MEIALLAHDSKKELMVQFCIAYCGILSGHSICATNNTGRLVADATGLKIRNYLSCRQGGDQQIGARIAYNEIDLVLFFSDPAKQDLSDVGDIVRLCDRQNVPIATNAATAEVLVQGLKRGDLDWRNLLKPRKNRK